ncbi:MAG: serine hydrolase [Verrucomicrobia bacterium]|nr:serine hydrolase [Verrucomicrobiota bacterium]
MRRQLLRHPGIAPDRRGSRKNGAASIRGLGITNVEDPLPVAGRVIEVATGTSINRAIRDLVFQPLGLDHAGTTAGEFITQRFAAGHSTRDGTTTLQRPFSPSTSVTAGGGGICMTDLLAYSRFHLGDGIAVNGARPDPRIAGATSHAAGAQAEHRRRDRQAAAEMPVSFYGPDRTVVTDGPQRGQSIEFVCDATGRVTWVRVNGRVAARTP